MTELDLSKPAPLPYLPIPHPGWHSPQSRPSLAEANSTIPIPPSTAPFFKKLFAFAGPGLLVAVGYMDPGNWATDIAGGAQFGYLLLSVVLLSNLMAILLQHLAIKLGVVTGRDLAQACRDHYSRPVSFVLWLLCEVAIAACDLAEVIGSAIALNLLFGLPIWIGILLTAADVLLILMLQHKGFRYIEAVVAILILTIFVCFGYQMVASRPDIFGILSGLVPRPQIITHPGMLYIAVGILGATVMPHNLYLHSSIVQTRNYPRDDAGKRYAVKFATLDSTISLALAFFVNAAILILAAAAFHGTAHESVAGINEAFKLLSPVLGATLASTLFAVALLAAGQNATLTGTLAGQIVMEGFLNLRLPPWLRRMITRLIAIIPAVIVSLSAGEAGVEKLLVLSQVILSLQLSFAVIPLVLFTSSKSKMAQFANGPTLKSTAWLVTGIIVALNAYLLFATVRDWLAA